MINSDVKLTSKIECFAQQTKIMDVDDDDEYTNAAAAHAAFVMTVSAASMYWLLRHAHHVRYINIQKLHPLPEKNIGLGSADFLHSGTGCIEKAVFVPSRFQSRFQSTMPERQRQKTDCATVRVRHRGTPSRVRYHGPAAG